MTKGLITRNNTPYDTSAFLLDKRILIVRLFVEENRSDDDDKCDAILTNGSSFSLLSFSALIGSSIDIYVMLVSIRPYINVLLAWQAVALFDCKFDYKFSVYTVLISSLSDNDRVKGSQNSFPQFFERQ